MAPRVTASISPGPAPVHEVHLRRSATCIPSSSYNIWAEVTLPFQYISNNKSVSVRICTNNPEELNHFPKFRSLWYYINRPGTYRTDISCIHMKTTEGNISCFDCMLPICMIVPYEQKQCISKQEAHFRYWIRSCDITLILSCDPRMSRIDIWCINTCYTITYSNWRVVCILSWCNSSNCSMRTNLFPVTQELTSTFFMNSNIAFSRDRRLCVYFPDAIAHWEEI